MTSKVPPVTLLVGDDGFLLRESALALLGDLRPREVDAAEWQGGELGDLATPSLFGEPRALVITNAKALSKDAIAELAAYLEVPDPGSRLILCCRVERGKAPAALLKVVEPSGEVKQVQVARKDLETWLVQRAKAAQLDLTPPGARALVGTIGEDLGQLASSLDQLADVFPSVRVTPELIHAQFRGLGDQKVWDLCDRAFARDLPGAIRSLRAVEEGGDDALKVLGGVAARLRDLIKVRALPDRLPPAQLAREAGLRFEWQARRYQQEARNYSMDQLIELHARLTEADRALKSGASGEVVMPTLVAAIAAG